MLWVKILQVMERGKKPWTTVKVYIEYVTKNSYIKTKNQMNPNYSMSIKEKMMKLQVINKILNPTVNSQIMHSNMHSVEKSISHVPFLKMPLRMHCTKTRT